VAQIDDNSKQTAENKLIYINKQLKIS